MQSLLGNIKIQIPEKVFQKDPESTELGKKIVESGIEMMGDLGFEAFTFKKLGAEIGSPESTIYRYFENKHKLLVYFINWYWGWLEYRLVFGTANISNAEEKLRKAIQIITENVEEDSDFSHINEKWLHQIVIAESNKVYLIKEVDKENKLGYYLAYKRLCQRIAAIVLEIRPKFKHPHTLVSTIIESSHLQKYFSEHLPRLTDCGKRAGDDTQFFTDMAFSMLKK